MDNFRFWGLIDLELRKASVERNLLIKLMVDGNDFEDPVDFETLKSLNQYNKISVVLIFSYRKLYDFRKMKRHRRNRNSAQNFV